MLRRTLALGLLAILAFAFIPDRSIADQHQLLMSLHTWLAAGLVMGLFVFMGWLLWRVD